MSESDPWDSILDVEAEHYNHGYKEGQLAAVQDGIINDGRRGGFMKGYAIGMEVGFMEGVTRHLTSQEELPRVKVDNDSGVQPIFHSRMSKRRKELLEQCGNVPMRNEPSFDFPSEVNQMRTVFKQCGTTLEFLPKKVKEAAPSQEW
jgi:hypothetical protein